MQHTGRMAVVGLLASALVSCGTPPDHSSTPRTSERPALRTAIPIPLLESATPRVTPSVTDARPSSMNTWSATVTRTANVRDYPSTERGKVLDQLAADTTITLVSKTVDGAWYEVATPQGLHGYMSKVVLTVPPDTEANIPVRDPNTAGAGPQAPASAEPMARVTKTANVRAYPSTQAGQVITQLSAGDSVTLLSTTPDKGWYEVTTPSGTQGYVSASLLTIAFDIAANVPARDPGPPPVVTKPAAKQVAPPASRSGCEPSYPDICIPAGSADLDCGEIPHRRFTVVGSDPHRFDGDNDGIGCESN